jgi:hypothetical protein
MSITEAIQILKFYRGPLGLTLHEPANEAQISEVELVFGITLPADFKTFYRFTDGFQTEEDMFNMMPLAEILDGKQRYKDDPLYFAEYMIFCDSWSLNIGELNDGEYTIIAGDPEGKQISLTNSLGEFIRRFLNGGVFEIGGLSAWADEIKAKLYGNTDPNKIKPLLWVFRECLKRGLMTKEDVIFRADWIIATEEDPDHFFIEMSLSRNMNELITVLDSIHLTESITQMRAFFGQVYLKVSTDQITDDKAVSILNHFSHDERLTTYERNKIMGLVSDFDYIQDRVIRPTKKLKQQLHDDVKDFLRHYWNFNLFYIKGWEKTNDDLVRKFESMNK